MTQLQITDASFQWQNLLRWNADKEFLKAQFKAFLAQNTIVFRSQAECNGEFSKFQNSKGKYAKR